MAVRILDMIYVRGDGDLNEDIYSIEMLQKLIIEVLYGRVVTLLLIWSEEVKPACHIDLRVMFTATLCTVANK